MRSIALFLCSHTDGTLLVGELANVLHLKVYTDEMLLHDINQRFGVSLPVLRKLLQGAVSEGELDRAAFITMARQCLVTRMHRKLGRCLYYGLHTYLLDVDTFRVLRVLVIKTSRAGLVIFSTKDDGGRQPAPDTGRAGEISYARESVWNISKRISSNAG
jgi:hypothetical protein